MVNTISITVGSTNPVKITSALNAFSAVFPDSVIKCNGISAPSGVSDQPMTESETRLGAHNRVKYCFNETSSSSIFYVSMEGGVDEFEEGAATFAYIAIIKDDVNEIFTGRSANLPLPDKVMKRLRNGDELAVVMDDLFKTKNVRQKGGAIGLLTNDTATRESVYTQALVLALAPIIHSEHYR